MRKAVERMQETFGTDPGCLQAGFGPAIGSCCYEVKEDVSAFFSAGVIKRNNKTYLDLVAVNKKDLLEAGVKPQNPIRDFICKWEKHVFVNWLTITTK